jgi:hypothetical protein
VKTHALCSQDCVCYAQLLKQLVPNVCDSTGILNESDLQKVLFSEISFTFRTLLIFLLTILQRATMVLEAADKIHCRKFVSVEDIVAVCAMQCSCCSWRFSWNFDVGQHQMELDVYCLFVWSSHWSSTWRRDTWQPASGCQIPEPFSWIVQVRGRSR